MLGQMSISDFFYHIQAPYIRTRIFLTSFLNNLHHSFNKINQQNQCLSTDINKSKETNQIGFTSSGRLFLPFEDGTTRVFGNLFEGVVLTLFLNRLIDKLSEYLAFLLLKRVYLYLLYFRRRTLKWYTFDPSQI